MKVFSNSRHLRTSSLALRVTLTWFLAFVGAGYVSNLALLVWKTRLSPSGIAAYYRGDEAAMQFPKEFHELLENTHFHVYIVPIVLLVLTHVFFMTAWSERAKVRITMIAYAAALADLLAPWLVRYAGAGFAWWKIASSLVYHAALIFLVAVPLYETWWGRAPPYAGVADEEEDDAGSAGGPPDL